MTPYLDAVNGYLTGPSGKRRLTKQQAQIAHLLAQQPGRVVRWEVLRETIHHGKKRSEHAVFVVLNLLRKEIAASGAGAIETVHGVGVRWVGI